MQISSTAWHYRVYNGWHERKHGYTREQIEADESSRPRWFRRQLDLCHYMRVVLLFAPARWIAHGRVGSPWYEKPWPYLATLVTVTGLVFWAVVNLDGLFVALALAGLIALILVSLGALAWFITYLHEDKGLTGDAIKGAVGGNIFTQYIIAKKRKICPLIEVKKP